MLVDDTAGGCTNDSGVDVGVRFGNPFLRRPPACPNAVFAVVAVIPGML
jgi:hypothetical protein